MSIGSTPGDTSPFALYCFNSFWSSAIFFLNAATSFNPPPERKPADSVESDFEKYFEISHERSLPKQEARPGFETVMGFPSSLKVSSDVISLIPSGKDEILLLLRINSFRF